MRHRAGTLSLVSVEEAQREMDQPPRPSRALRVTFHDAHGLILKVWEMPISGFPVPLADDDYPLCATVEVVTQEQALQIEIPHHPYAAPVWVAGPMTREEFVSAYPPREPDPGYDSPQVFGPAEAETAQRADALRYPEFVDYPTRIPQEQ